MAAIEHTHTGTSADNGAAGVQRHLTALEHPRAQDMADQGQGSAPQPGLKTGLVFALLVLAALLWAGPERIGTFTGNMLQAYLDAQQTMLAATGNLTADGRAEFAVLLSDGASARDLRTAMSGIEDVTFAREADLSGWVIVTTAAGNRDGLDALLALPQSRLVVPNRGLWICH